MRKKADEYIYTAEKYFFSASIAALIKQGKSIYEIALLMQAHTDLLERFVFTDELNQMLSDNNQSFLKLHCSRFTDVNRSGSKIWDEYGVMQINEKYYFYRHYPKTLAYWLKKNKYGEQLFKKVLTAAKDFDAINSGNTEPCCLNRVFEIVNDYLDGNREAVIKRKHHYNKKQLAQLRMENKLPVMVSKDCVMKRMEDALNAGADYDFLRNQFSGVSNYAIATMIKQQDNMKVIPMINTTKMPVVERPKGIVIKYKFSSKKALMLKQKICLRHFSLGDDVEQIAAKMSLDKPLVIALLRRSGALA